MPKADPRPRASPHRIRGSVRSIQAQVQAAPRKPDPPPLGAHLCDLLCFPSAGASLDHRQSKRRGSANEPRPHERVSHQLMTPLVHPSTEPRPTFCADDPDGDLPSIEDTRIHAAEITAWAARVSDGDGDDEDADLPDVLGAFEACDIDSSGAISASELHAVLVAIGADISVAEVEQLIANVKEESSSSSDSTSDDDSVSTAANAGGGSRYTMDERGLRMKRKKLAHRKHRHNLSASTVRHAVRDHAPISFGNAVNFSERQREREKIFEQQQAELDSLVAADLDEMAQAAVDTHPDELDQEDFVRLVRGKSLNAFFLPRTDSLGNSYEGGWRERVGEIRALRRAYDIVDIDGDNCMQRDELVQAYTKMMLFPLILR